MDLTLKSRRKFWFQVHLYLGLFGGAIFVLIGLTGSLLAFDDSIDAWLNPDLLTVPIASGNASFLPIDQIVASGVTAMPKQGKILDIGFPRRPGQPFDLWFEQPAPHTDYAERHQIFINPYTAEVTGQRLLIDFERPWRNPLMDFVLRLHYSLALGSAGMPIVGFFGMALLFLLLTGLIVWWPLSGKFSKALLIRRNTKSKRLNFDLHKTLGFYSAAVLLFLSLSGVYLIFPDYGMGLIRLFSPVSPDWPDYQSRPPASDQTKPLSLTGIIRICDARFPDGSYRRLFFPQHDKDVFLVSKSEPDEPNQKLPRRRLWLDQYSGKILHAEESKGRTAGDKLVEWLYPLHSGEAFGLTGQYIILVTGFIPLLLYVTGIIRWLQKRRAKVAHQSRTKQSSLQKSIVS